MLKLKLKKFVSTSGLWTEKEIFINQTAIAYVDTSDDEKIKFQLIGDPSLYLVTDKDSMNIIRKIL